MVLTALQIANNPKSVKGGLERADGSNPEMGEVVARRCRGGQDHASGAGGDGAQPLDPRAKVGAEVETKEGGLRAGLIAHFHSASVPVKCGVRRLKRFLVPVQWSIDMTVLTGSTNMPTPGEKTGPVQDR
jgi:hypothetical protein